jgi:uncharacterized lipoprotein YmbA
VLAGCASSPPDHFYSLSSGGIDAATAPASTGASTGTGSAAASTQPLYIELQAVAIPQRVARSQIVINSGEGRVDLLEQERWAAPLSAEIGQALSQDLTAGLGAIDVYRSPTPPQAAVYRISTSVQRFESAPGQYALVDAVWSVRRVGSDAVLTCRSVADEKVGAGYDALVLGHRRALARIAASIAQGVRTVAAGAPSC